MCQSWHDAATFYKLIVKHRSNELNYSLHGTKQQTQVTCTNFVRSSLNMYAYMYWLMKVTLDFLDKLLANLCEQFNNMKQQQHKYKAFT